MMNMIAATKGAYCRGICNGIKGIWDGGKMLVTETDKVLEGIYQSGSEFLEAPLKNTWEFLGDIKDGFIDSVWRSTPQEIAEDAGELAFDVAISVPTGGAGKVVSGAAKGIGKIKYLDNLVDIGKISQKIPSLQGMPLPAGGVLPFNLADDFLKAPYQMIKPDGEDVAKLTAMGDDVVKQGAKEVKKPDTIDSQKVIKEKSGKETESGVQITDSVKETEIKNIKKEIDGERQSEITSNRNILLRGDYSLYSNVRNNGIRKSYISSEGDLIPASITGIYQGRQVTVTEHILGGYRRGAKGNSPYTSFTSNRNIVLGYGNNLITVDISKLRKAIRSGDVTGVAILSPKQIQKLIKNDTMQSNFWKKRALNWTKRDCEYLIRGIIPSEFIKIN